jgi:hypothetical protein
MNSVTVWVTKIWNENSGVKHFVVIASGFFLGLYTTDPGVKVYVNGVALQIYNALPHWLEGAIVGLIIPAIGYWNSSRATTAVVPLPTTPAATKAVIKASGN